VTATEAAAQMLTRPDDFFKSYPVMVAGATTGQWFPNAVNVKTFHLAKKGDGSTGQGRGSDTKEGHYGATRKGRIGQTLNISSFKLEEFTQPNCSGPLTTHGVPMVNYNSHRDGNVNLNANIAAMDYYQVDGGAQYMTTGLLTGCSFAWNTIPNGLRCIHIRPEGIDASLLRDNLAAIGRFGLAPHDPLQAFGRQDYEGAPYAVVIGVKHAGAWRLYAQTSTDVFKTIRGAWRIHPGPKTPL